MTDEACLDELLSQWQAEKARGRDLPALAMCRERPEMAEELGRRIEAVRRMSALAQADGTPCIPSPKPVVPAALVTAAPLVQGLREYRLLEPAQLQELEALLPRFADARALAGELIRRSWLTPYQANQLLQGRGRELVLGSYVLLERLGEGGMGQVFKARNWKLGRVVALKVIRKDRLANPDAVRRFRREVQAAAALSHPNIVHAYDADEIDGTHLLVMECVEGASDLARLLKKNGPLPVAQACKYIRQAALGLQHACARGMVHRDIKPQNMLLSGDGRTVKILDMGLARLDHSEADGDRTSTMTQEGAIMGTPDYIAPEQVMGSHDVDIRADLYSLGCTFYQLLTDRVPFPGGTLMQKLDGHRFHEAASVESLRPDVPPAVAAVVRRLMAKKPEDRYQTPADVAAALVSGDGDTPVGLAGTGATVVQKPVAAVVPTRAVASPFADLDAGATEVLAPPMKAPGTRRRWLLPALAGMGLAAVGLAALLIVLLPKGDKGPPQNVAILPADSGAQPHKGPKKVDDAWLKKVAGMPAENQVAMVMSKLKELNPGFDGKETHKIEGGVVTQLDFVSDSVTDISPVPALAGLKGLVCQGSVTGLGKLTDLSPLKGMQLTYFSCNHTQVADLSPLAGMPLVELGCYTTRVADLSPLKGMKLEGLAINESPVADLSPLKGMKLKAFGCSWTKVSDLSPLKDMPLINVQCGGTSVSDLSPLAGMKLVELSCVETKVADLSPLKDMPLVSLSCAHTPISDLSPLRGVPLTYFACYRTQVSDLSPLKGMPLTNLECSSTKVKDLSPLKDMKLTALSCIGTPVADLSPLQGMPLESLTCCDTKVSDLSPLKGMKLNHLNCERTPVSDLSPLQGMPLAVLGCQGTKLTDLSPLKGMPLKQLTCDFKPERDSAILRSLTTLETINSKPAGEFWKDVEAKKP